MYILYFINNFQIMMLLTSKYVPSYINNTYVVQDN